MGSGIAAQLCNANIPVTLLDLKTDISQKAKDKIFKELILSRSLFSLLTISKRPIYLTGLKK